MIEHHHLTDRQLRELLFEPEERLDATDISRHIETCQSCQIRLTELTEQDSIELEACQMLSDYHHSSHNECSRSSSPSLPSSSSPASLEGGSEWNFDRDLLGSPSHPEMLGRIGRYEIERFIGSGGMGVVFKAIDTELNRPVAIKILASHLARNGSARQRFSRESRAAAAVVHEHVVAIHNVDSSGEHPYLVMQYVAGESLQARVDREGPLGVEQILRIGVQAALGLAAAHQQGIVHRDIKPANILLEDGVERLLITDFGLARTVDDASLTHTGVVAGTPNYMSPEQAKGDEADHRTDLFSLGSVLYFVATGHPPFRAERAMGVLHRICHEPHRPVWQINPNVPDELSMAIDRLLEKRPARRYPNASAVAESLTRILQHVQGRKPTLSAHLRSWRRRHPGIVLSATMLVLATSMWFLGTGFLPLLSSRLDPDQNRRTPTFTTPNADPKLGSTQQDSLPPVASAATPPPGGSTDSVPSASDIINADRFDFDQNIQWMHQKLNQIDQSGSNRTTREHDSFELELRALNEKLQSIDPVRKE